jgi:hypothetical protein
MFLMKALLQWMKLPSLLHSLDCLNFLIVRLNCEDSTGLDRLSIQEHCAGTTAGCVTTNMRAGQSQIIAEKMDQQFARVNFTSE